VSLYEGGADVLLAVVVLPLSASAAVLTVAVMLLVTILIGARGRREVAGQPDG
jgi:hypothetical protein